MINVDITCSCPGCAIIRREPGSTGSTAARALDHVGSVPFEDCLACVAISVANNLSSQHFRFTVTPSTHPLIVIQCGNSSRLYPSCDPCAATVNPASSLVAVEVDGIPGGEGAGNAPPRKGWKAKTRTQAVREIPIVVFFWNALSNQAYNQECRMNTESISKLEVGSVDFIFLLYLLGQANSPS